jgi:hypothetical protein
MKYKNMYAPRATAEYLLLILLTHKPGFTFVPMYIGLNTTTI